MKQPEREGRARLHAVQAGRSIRLMRGVLIRGLGFTAVVAEPYFLANGVLCLETLLIASVPFPLRRVSGCKEMSGEGQGEKCFVNRAWDLEQDFNSPSSRCSTTQCRLFKLVMRGDI